MRQTTTPPNRPRTGRIPLICPPHKATELISLEYNPTKFIIHEEAMAPRKLVSEVVLVPFVVVPGDSFTEPLEEGVGEGAAADF